MSRMFDPSKFEPPIEFEVNYTNDSSEQEKPVEVDTAASNKQSYECDNYLIDLSKKYPKIEYTMEINGIVTFPKGNLQAIKAKAKSGKTTLNICLTTAILRGEFLSIKSLIKDPKICYFATEEHISNVAENNKKTHQLCNWDTERSNERFRVYTIREVETIKRISIIEEALEKEKPDIVVLDGIRDLLIDFNNIQQSHEIITRLLHFSGKYNCAIVCVLHTNKSYSDSNMRGHLGTELLNKSSDVFEVEKRRENNFVVTHTDSRYKETGEWAFRFDEDGLLIAGEIQNKTQNKPEQGIVKMEQYFSKIFTENKSLSNSDLKKEYMALSGLKESAANKHIREMTEKGFLKKGEDGNYELADV